MKEMDDWTGNIVDQLWHLEPPIVKTMNLERKKKDIISGTSSHFAL